MSRFLFNLRYRTEMAAHRAEMEEIREGIARIRRGYIELQWVEDQLRSA